MLRLSDHRNMPAPAINAGSTQALGAEYSGDKNAAMADEPIITTPMRIMCRVLRVMWRACSIAHTTRQAESSDVITAVIYQPLSEPG